RDFHVTGVQTCALPICSLRNTSGFSRLVMSGTAAGRDGSMARTASNRADKAEERAKGAQLEMRVFPPGRSTRNISFMPRIRSGRSEERRGGEDWRTART